MNAPDALRFLDHEAGWCREKDEHEALCLLLPALIRVLDLPKMTPQEALEFRQEFKAILRGELCGDHEASRVGCGGRT